MGYYLLDHPNPNGDHFYRSRNKKLIAQVIHITASLEDIDLIGPDASAESTAHYAAVTDRQVSWHTGSDTDSFINLLPYSYTAFQVVGYNSSTAGHEISKLETNWRDDDPDLVRARLIKAADAIRGPMKANGIPFRKATKAEVDNAIATHGSPVGMISHKELDPDRRTDPGWVNGVDTFPWDQFISILKEEDDDVALAPDESAALKEMAGNVKTILTQGFRSTDASGNFSDTSVNNSVNGVNKKLVDVSNKLSGVTTQNETIIELLQKLVENTTPVTPPTP